MKDEIKKLQKQVEEIERRILKLAGYKDLVDPYFSVVGHWDCPNSFCGLCCYDHYYDPVHDSCVFCGQPEERK